MDLHPQEIVDIIIGQFKPHGDEQRTLFTTSLVCRRWLAPSRRQLFEHLHVFGNDKKKSFFALLESTASTSEMTRAIRSIYLVDVGGNSQPTWDELVKTMAAKDVFPRKLTLLLHSRYGGKSTVFSRAGVQAILSTWARGIQSLDLEWPDIRSNGTNSALPEFLGHFSALRELRLSYRQPASALLAQSVPPFLSSLPTLTLRLSERTLEPLLQWLGTSSLSLESVCLLSRGHSSLLHVAQLSRFVASQNHSISSLELDSGGTRILLLIDQRHLTYSSFQHFIYSKLFRHYLG